MHRYVNILTLLLVLCSAVAISGFAQDSSSRQQPLTPLAQVLNPDGTVNLKSGFSGSLDPKGWKMVTATNAQPRFVQASVQSKAAAPAPAASGDENWDDRFTLPGVNDQVYALAVDGTNVYVGGQFTTAGGVSANYIAKWDGSSWSALGNGVDSTVYAIAVNGTNVYVGGEFTMAGGVSANHIAKWDGSTWSALGSGVDGSYISAHK